MSTPTDAAALREAVDGRQWYHTIDLGHGVLTPGWFDTRAIASRVPMAADLSGLRTLDVGTFDGFWAFEMERRGAAEVVAIDVPDPASWDWPASVSPQDRAQISARHDGGGGFEIAHRALDSHVRRERLNVYDVSPDRVGHFDVVYVGSLLLHLRDPVRALERVRSVCRGQLVLVDAIDPWTSLQHPRAPVARLDGRGRPWWWKPNMAALGRMVEAAGFTVTAGPRRLWMPAGAGQPRPPLRGRALRAAEGRTTLLHAYVGDPHAMVQARPQTP